VIPFSRAGSHVVFFSSMTILRRIGVRSATGVRLQEGNKGMVDRITLLSKKGIRAGVAHTIMSRNPNKKLKHSSP
jgi:hypothetical protein